MKRVSAETATAGRVRLVCGGNASARAAEIDRVVLAHWGHALLIVPTRAQARRRADHLIRENALPGVFGECVLEFNDFARRVLELDGIYPETLDNFARRLLLENQLELLGGNKAFAAFRAAAGTPGFAAQVLRIITELKQAAIEPDEFRNLTEAARTRRTIDGAIALAYSAYQRALLASGCYDIPGMYWEADLRCRSARPRLLDGIDAICFDGFDDFTPSQIRLIESASVHVSQVLVGVNYDEDPDRADLYALSAKTARTLATRFGCVAEYHAAPAPARHSQFAARTLFWRNPPVPPGKMTSDLSVVPCADPTHELETIARRVKTLLVNDGVAPDRIAIVFMRIGGAIGTIRSVFAEMGIPVRVSGTLSLASTAVGALLLRAIAALEDWERERVLEVLTSPLVRSAAFQSEARGAFRMIARQAGILAGYEHWTSRLEWLMHALRGPALREHRALLDRYPGAAVAAAELLQQARLLYALWEKLPPEGTPHEYAVAFEEFCNVLGLAAAIDQAGDPELATRERAAIDALGRLLDVLARSDDRPVRRHTFLRLLENGICETDCSVPSPPGAVGVYEASAVRNLDFDHVFFAGLNEGEVPAPGGINAVYSEADLEELRALGVGLAGQGEHNLRERLLFHHVLETAREHLTLSWHVHSPGGKETGRSPFLKEILNVFGDAMSIEESAPFSDAFVPKPEAIACARDLRNSAFLHAAALRDVYGDRFKHIQAATAIERARRDESAFGPYDGVLGDGAVLADLAANFSADRCFSVSQLESYLECPFRFFQEQIMRVTESVEPSDEMEPRLRGLLLHDAMRRFHERHRGRCFAEIGEDEAFESAQAAVDDAFGAVISPDSMLPPGAVQIERGRMIATIKRYVCIEREREREPWRPVLLEAAFGGAPQENGDTPASAQPFVLETSEGPVRFSGRIDRIDETGEFVRVVDYKSSEPPAPKEVKEGRSIQLGVYAQAAEEVFCPGKTCVEAVFLQPGRKKKTEALDRAERGGGREERRRILAEAVANAVRAIREGRFPPVAAGQACRACGHEKACRFERARIERKTGAAAGSDEDT